MEEEDFDVNVTFEGETIVKKQIRANLISRVACDGGHCDVWDSSFEFEEYRNLFCCWVTKRDIN